MKAFITGITGQDGSYLTELLLAKGYIVHGLIRCCSTFNTSRIDHLYEDKTFKSRLFLHYGDLSQSLNLLKLVQEIQPDEIYHLGAQSHVQVSFQDPEFTTQVDALGTLRLLEAVRVAGLTQKVKFYQASTSELFGLVQETPQSETTPFYPRSPYGCAKLYSFAIVRNYREAYGMFAVNGILFNHESPRRKPTFVTRKITQGVANIVKKKQDCIYLGNLDAQRDWSHAKDFVQAMHLMLQQDKPEDFVVASGETRSIRDCVQTAFAVVGMRIHWEGKGLEETGTDQDGQVRVRVDPKYFRPAEVDLLLGDARKIRKRGWKPSVSFHDLIQEMVEADLKA